MKNKGKQWTLIDWIVFSVRLLLYLSICAYYLVEYPLDTSLYVILLLFFLSYSIPQLFWRPGYINIQMFSFSEIIFSGSLSIYLTLLSPDTFLMISSFMIGYLAYRKTLWWSAPTIVLIIPLIEGVLIGNITHSLIHVVTYIAAFGLGLCLYYVDTSKQRLNKLLKENEEKTRRIEEQNQTLIQYSEQIEQLTLAEERSRMARELHDTVGHTFTSSIVGIEASIYLIDHNPEKAKLKLRKIHKILNQELEVVRNNIHAMVADEDIVSLADQLEKIISRFCELTSSKVQFDVIGVENNLNGAMKMTLVRCLQEALTNSKRHGEASQFHVILTYDSDQTQLTIADNGLGSKDIIFGFGLSSMEERLHLFGGKLTIDSIPGKGTTITCTIPLGGEKN